MFFQRQTSSASFNMWLREDQENRRLLLFGLVIALLQITLFKYFYPFPNFMPPDSDNYLEAAWKNEFINIWPIGYSKFLRLISSFSNSHFVLILIQYSLVLGSLFYLLFTIRYILSPGKWVFRTLLFFSILNPLIPHISNFVSSDALFASLSLIWFTQLIWIKNKPSKTLLILHAFVLLLAFMVRFNALYYPLFSVPIIAYSTARTTVKWSSISLIFVLLSFFIARTEYEYFKVTGTKQFSAFSGWQLGSNALYGYAYAKPDPVNSVPLKFQDLHSIVNGHMDSINRLHERPDKEVAVYYLWDFQSPLRVYLKNKRNSIENNDSDFFKYWATVAPLYTSYGAYLIAKHPLAFLKHYAWPNFIKYYAPPPKFMGSYNMGSKTVNPIVVRWFHWKNNNLPNYFKDGSINITSIFTPLSAIINVVFILSFIGVYFLGGFRRADSLSKQVIYIVFLFWIINMVFSVLAAPIELRYQIFPIMTVFSFMWLLLIYIIKSCLTTERSSNGQEKIPTSQIIPST